MHDHLRFRAPRPIVLFGSQGYAQTIRDLMRRYVDLEPLFDVRALIDDYRGDSGEIASGTPIVSFETWRTTMHDVPILITLGDPHVRKRIADRIVGVGGSFASAVDRNEVDARSRVGLGTLLTPGNAYGRDLRIGDHVQVLPLATIPDGTILHDFVTLCPCVTIEGRVTIEEGVFVGAGARLTSHGERLTVGRNATVAAGATVTGDVAAGAVVYGDPARALRFRTGKRSAT